MSDTPTNESSSTKPLLLFIRGIPGSGKSYLAQELAKRIGLDNVTLLDPDDIDKNNPDYIKLSDSLSKEGLDSAIHPFRWLRKQACEGSTNNKTVIWNQPFTVFGVFDRLVLFIQKYASENGIDLPVLVVEIMIDKNIAENRITERINSGGHGPSTRTFNKRVEEFNSFEESYQVIKVDGSDDIEKSIQSILASINNISAD